MFHVSRPAANRLDIEFGGRLDSERMRTIIDELVRASDGIAHGRMLYRVRDFDWPTPGAIGIELMRMPELYGLVGRFERIAVLADSKWLRALGRFEGALIPGVEIKGFALDQQADAEAWLAG